MEEKREIEQRKIYDEDGKLKYTIIPNYVKTDYFMSANEIRFYKFLVNVIIKIKQIYNENLEIFPQVAINRLIKQNNRRETELAKDIFCRSIDYVIYDKDNDIIKCCIELDGEEHNTDKERIKRDKIINNAFKDNIKLIRQPVVEYYSEKELIEKIMR